MKRPENRSTPTLEQLKSEAKALRAACPAEHPITHCEALEAVARKHGFANWNIARARARAPFDRNKLTVGNEVIGNYLGQPFKGVLSAVRMMPGEMTRVVISLENPIDVVRFRSFSSFRRRLTAVLSSSGICPNTTSDGTAHLEVITVRKPRRVSRVC